MGFISPLIAFILLAIGVLALFTRFGKSIVGMIPIGNPRLWSVLFIVAGLVFGGITYGTGLWSSATSGISTGSLISDEVQAAAVSSALIGRCDYSASTAGLTGNTTVRASTNENNVVYYDIDKSEYGVYSGTAGNNISSSFTCIREGSAQEAESYELVVKCDEYRSETSTTDTATYNLVTTSSTPSSIWTGKYVQTAYINDGSVATTSSTQEYGFVNYAAGEKSSTVFVYAEPDNKSVFSLNTGTNKACHFYQRTADGDREIFKTVVNVLA
jgi:hypothetical protein